jgi:hypothetical protein
MRVSLNLLLDIEPGSPDDTIRLLRGHIVSALLTNPEIRLLTKRIRVGTAKPILSLHEAKQAGGRARAASLSPAKRKKLARLAAQARWNRVIKEK